MGAICYYWRSHRHGGVQQRAVGASDSAGGGGTIPRFAKEDKVGLMSFYLKADAQLEFLK